MDGLIDFAIGSIATFVLIYILLSIVGMMVVQSEDQLDLSPDQRSELEKTASNFFGWLMFIVNTPGKEAITICIALLGGLANISKNHR